jgi:chemotaxis protein MotB
MAAAGNIYRHEYEDVAARPVWRRRSIQEKINVNGYTDNTPIGPGLAKKGVTTNQILSQKRADTVMEYMVSQGVKPDLVAAHGYGESDPVAPNDTAEGRARNRRVELTIAK